MKATLLAVLGFWEVKTMKGVLLERSVGAAGRNSEDDQDDECASGPPNIQKKWRPQSSFGSILLDGDGALGTVVGSASRLGDEVLAETLDEQPTVPLLVLADHVGREFVAATVADTQRLVEPDLHGVAFHTSGR